MSDPAKSSAEIEDVLSSIRRLVSEHQPARNGSGMEPVPGAVADRLVLTPSLRVSEPDDPWRPVPQNEDADVDDVAESVSEIMAQEDDEPDDQAMLDSTEAEAPVWHEALEDDVEASVLEVADMSEDGSDDAEDATGEDLTLGADDGAEAEFDDDGAEDAPEADTDDAEEIEMALIDGDIPRAAAFESDTGDAGWPDSSADHTVRGLAAMRNGASDGEWNPGSASAEETIEIVRDALSERADEDILGVIETEPKGEDEREPKPGPRRFKRRMNLSVGDGDMGDDAVAALEDAPEEGSVEAAADEALVEEPAHMDGAAFVAEDEVEDLGDDPSPFTFPDEDEDDSSILDEETLREMIVDIVREELQGVMGQRITRNVRKMVRREIRMALAAEELD